MKKLNTYIHTQTSQDMVDKALGSMNNILNGETDKNEM